MKITSIPQMTEINIKMVCQGTEIKSSTRVLTSYGEGILVTPITLNGQVINYCSTGSLEYEDPFTGEVHTFILDSIARTDFNGVDFHVLTGKENTIVDRKRKAERYMVQKMGAAVINKKRTANMMVNDISVRGISLVIGNDNSVNVGDQIKITFMRDVAKKLTVNCRVVRLFDIHGLKAAGCVFTDVSTDIITYVHEKKEEYKEKMSVKVAG